MPKQSELNGIERPRIEEIDEAAEAYVKVRDRRMNLTEQECAAKLNLLNHVQAHAKELSVDADGNRIYRFDDLMVILKPGKPNVKVKSVHDHEEEDED